VVRAISCPGIYENLASSKERYTYPRSVYPPKFLLFLPLYLTLYHTLSSFAHSFKPFVLFSLPRCLILHLILSTMEPSQAASGGDGSGNHRRCDGSPQSPQPARPSTGRDGPSDTLDEATHPGVVETFFTAGCSRKRAADAMSPDEDRVQSSQDEPLPTQPTQTPLPSAQGHSLALAGPQLSRPSAPAPGFIERNRSRTIEELIAIMRQPQNAPNQDEATGICRNCMEPGHTAEGCKETCLTCGRHSHSLIYCYDGEPCACTKFPYHDPVDCSINCLYCAIVTPQKEPHLFVDCVEMCHLCFDREHTTLQCRKGTEPFRPCPSCQKGDGSVEFHFPSSCVYNWCPATRTFEKETCADHCMQCGYSKAEENALGTEHRCQFKKIWLPGQDVFGRPVVGLQCKQNSRHVFKFHEVLDTRENAQREILARPKNRRDLGSWPLECPKCIGDGTKNSRA
jgi:hypothetical protein